MSDLIARMQDMVDFKHDDMDVAREAIEEIARLRAELATARLEGMEEAAKWHEVRSGELSGKIGSARNFRQLLQKSDFHMESAAAIRAAAKEDRQP